MIVLSWVPLGLELGELSFPIIPISHSPFGDLLFYIYIH